MLGGIDLTTLGVLLLAAFGAGVLNAIAGGGSFLTFPALVWAGIPPIPANATSAIVVAPGYLGSTLGFRQELGELPRRTLRNDALVSAIGGVAGALLLLVTPAKVFAGIVPWLLLLATVLFALGPRLARRSAGAGGSLARWRLPGLLLVTTYGGYFNGGLGILLLALFGLLGQTQLNAMNGMKNLVSALLTAIAVAIYAAGGIVLWPQALMMMVAATAGGYGGARVARRIPAPWLRGGIVVTGLVMAWLFFWRQ